MIEIMVVDDQRLVRRCISAKLNAVEDFTVTAEAASGEEARDAVRARHFDVILMDLNMPGIGGLEATRRVLAARPDCRILGLSMYVSGPYPKQFLRTGGAGYVSKNTDLRNWSVRSVPSMMARAISVPTSPSTSQPAIRCASSAMASTRCRAVKSRFCRR